MLQFYAKPFASFLVEINSELIRLYSLMQNVSGHEGSSLSISGVFGIPEASKERFDKTETIMELKNKIELWCLFYKTVSICVL